MFATGQTALNDTVWASALLDFGSGKWDHTQFSFRVGGGEGDPILAAVSLQDFNICFLKENSVWLYQTQPEATIATQWTSRKLSVGSGIAGKHAWALCDNDVYYMARGEGVRMVSRMQAAAGQYDVSPPLSAPMQPYIDRINWSRGHLIEGRAYKHLVFFAVPLDASNFNNYVLVFNRRLGRWTGVWTSWTPACWETTRFAGVQRLVFGEQTGLVRQWKDYADVADDDTYLDDGDDIATKMWSRGFQFGEMFNDKSSRDIEARFSASNAIVTLTLIGDNSELRMWTADVTGSGPDLPVDLPFDLFSPAAIKARRGLRGLQRFNECYVKVESSAGWFSLRSLTMTAYSKRMPTLTA
jgi:hypothetical protein